MSFFPHHLPVGFSTLALPNLRNIVSTLVSHSLSTRPPLTSRSPSRPPVRLVSKSKRGTSVLAGGILQIRGVVSRHARDVLDRDQVEEDRAAAQVRPTASKVSARSCSLFVDRAPSGATTYDRHQNGYRTPPYPCRFPSTRFSLSFNTIHSFSNPSL